MEILYSIDNRIVEYIVNKISPNIINGNIPTIHDPLIGTGGFILNSLKYLNDNHPDINWEINKLNISGFEIDRAIHYSTLQTLYNYSNINFVNTIKHEHCIKVSYSNKYDIIMTDLNKISDFSGGCRQKRTEISFIKYMMMTLKVNGRAAFIIKDKYLTCNKKNYIKIRKQLLLQFNLHHVISINDPEINYGYKNKMSILFFDNNGPTSNINFYNITYNGYNIIETYDTCITHDRISAQYYYIYNLSRLMFISTETDDNESLSNIIELMKI